MCFCFITIPHYFFYKFLLFFYPFQMLKAFNYHKNPIAPQGWLDAASPPPPWGVWAFCLVGPQTQRSRCVKSLRPCASWQVSSIVLKTRDLNRAPRAPKYLTAQGFQTGRSELSGETWRSAPLSELEVLISFWKIIMKWTCQDAGKQKLVQEFLPPFFPFKIQN